MIKDANSFQSVMHEQPAGTKSILLSNPMRHIQIHIYIHIYKHYIRYIYQEVVSLSHL